MSGLTATGFVAKTFEEIKAEIESELLNAISPDLDLSADQPLGQIVGIVSQREATLWELLATAFNAFNPSGAEHFLLDNLAALTGTLRRAPTKSSVLLRCNVTNGFTAVKGSMMANVNGQPENRFVNANDVGPLSPAGDHDIEFESLDLGPAVANAGTLTVITAPVSGWNSCTNPEDAVLGRLDESDADLMNRREEELAASGSGTIDAIRADVLHVKGVQQAYVFENVTSASDVNGLPPHSFEVVVHDGIGADAADPDVAQVIWNSKPSGIETHGSIATTVEDSRGQSRTVKWSRATVSDVWLTFNITIDPEDFPTNGINEVKAAAVAYGAKILNLGVDVVSARMKRAAFDVPGVLDVPTLYLGFGASPAGTTNLTITGRQIASLDTSRIVVNVTTGTP